MYTIKKMRLYTISFSSSYHQTSDMLTTYSCQAADAAVVLHLWWHSWWGAGCSRLLFFLLLLKPILRFHIFLLYCCVIVLPQLVLACKFYCIFMLKHAHVCMYVCVCVYVSGVCIPWHSQRDKKKFYHPLDDSHPVKHQVWSIWNRRKDGRTPGQSHFIHSLVYIRHVIIHICINKYFILRILSSVFWWRHLWMKNVMMLLICGKDADYSIKMWRLVWK